MYYVLYCIIKCEKVFTGIFTFSSLFEIEKKVWGVKILFILIHTHYNDINSFYSILLNFLNIFRNFDNLSNYYTNISGFKYLTNW